MWRLPQAGTLAVLKLPATLLLVALALMDHRHAPVGGWSDRADGAPHADGHPESHRHGHHVQPADLTAHHAADLTRHIPTHLDTHLPAVHARHARPRAGPTGPEHTGSDGQLGGAAHRLDRADQPGARAADSDDRLGRRRPSPGRRRARRRRWARVAQGQATSSPVTAPVPRAHCLRLPRPPRAAVLGTSTSGSSRRVGTRMKRAVAASAPSAPHTPAHREPRRIRRRCRACR